MVASADDTIFALASGAGAAGVAVIRISGPRAFQEAEKLCGKLPQPGHHSLRSLRDRDGDLIDQALVLSFLEGASFSGEDVVEFQTHGSPAVVTRILSVLGQGENTRIAEAGEFTRRAFENGRMDLTQVEGLAALIEAETESQRKLALEIFGGALSDEISRLRSSVLRAAALCEATIDFADEEVPENVVPEVRELISQGLLVLDDQLSGSGAAKAVNKGFQIAILGPVNAGKSSIINAIAGSDVAIVSDIEGTTRDVVELTVSLNGQRVTFLDTAGLRETDNAIEAEGIRRAKARAEAADVRLLISPDSWEDREINPRDDDIRVFSKGDVTGRRGAISAKTGEGISELLAQISEIIGQKAAGSSLVTEARQERELSEARNSLEKALAQLDRGADMEIVAQDIREALGYLSRTVGAAGVEDILGEIFSSFCIGK